MKNFSGVCQAAGADKPLRAFFIWITNIVTLSNQRAVCPDAPFISRLHPSVAKITLCLVTSKRTDKIPPFPGSDTARPEGPGFHEKHSKTGTLIPR